MKMNSVVHFEIPADDIERAQKFYKELFGWNIEKAGEMPYWIAKTGECDENEMPKESGFINGGLMERNAEQDPSGVKPVIVIKVEDLTEHLKKIEEAGGKVVMPAMDVGDMGHYARIEDTEGNVVGVWQDKKE
jgi:uncharacterized protein